MLEAYPTTHSNSIYFAKLCTYFAKYFTEKPHPKLIYLAI